ncbi:MAG TPA: peroxiredoxin family protein [Phycisphaerae bacterium]
MPNPQQPPSTPLLPPRPRTSFPPPAIRKTLRLLIVPTLFMAITACKFQSQPPPAPAIKIGDLAPDFSLSDAQDNTSKPVTLSQLTSQGPVVIIFHRGMNCAICVEHLLDTARHAAEFKNAGIQVLAIGPDTLDGMREALRTRETVPFPLLSDSDDKVAVSYGLKGSKGYLLHGVFVVDKDRRVRLAETSDDPVGTISELIDAAKTTANLR